MKNIARVFRETFGHWGISLPEGDVSGRRGGSIRRRGWIINYHFGTESGREYLEYFASHRMTNDTLVRIYEDGATEQVDYCRVLYRVDDPNAKQEYFDHNRRFYERVRELGLA